MTASTAPPTSTSTSTRGAINITKQTRPPSTAPSKPPATYLLSDDRALINLPSLAAAFASPLLWWAKPLSSLSALETLVVNSYCLGLYHIADNDNGENKEMVGFARLVTDYVTFAYLTDVYVLEEHQGRGLGTFMMEGIKAAMAGWGDLRRGLLLTNDPGAVKVYERVFGAVDIKERSRKDSSLPELICMEWKKT